MYSFYSDNRMAVSPFVTKCFYLPKQFFNGLCKVFLLEEHQALPTIMEEVEQNAVFKKHVGDYELGEVLARNGRCRARHVKPGLEYRICSQNHRQTTNVRKKGKRWLLSKSL